MSSALAITLALVVGLPAVSAAAADADRDAMLRGASAPAAHAPAAHPLVQVQHGDLPIVLSAPHGGRQVVEGVEKRRGEGVPQFATLHDVNTAELAEALSTELERRLGKKPCLVIARFSRASVDANRPAAHAFESDRARPAYEAYHAALSQCCRAVRERWGAGLLLDLHGQSTYPDAVVRGTQNGTTVERLVAERGRDALVGPEGLTGLLAAAGLALMPAPGAPDREPAPFAGGYITRTYGSHRPDGLDAVQLEFGRNLRRDDSAVRDTARRAGEAVAAFLRAYLPVAEQQEPPSEKGG